MRPTPDWPLRDLLAHRARVTPEATAVLIAADGRSLTYRALDATVERAADRLRDHLGPRPGSPDGVDRPRIAIAAAPTLPFVVGLFATWRVGARAVPLDADAPAAQLRGRLDHLDPRVLVGDLAYPGDNESAVAVEIDTLVDGIPQDSEGDRPGSVGAGPTQDGDHESGWAPTDPALCLFTSGTSGEPKGVRLSHRNLVASAAGSAYRLGLDPADRWLDCLPPNHMGGLAPIVRATCYGTTVVLQKSFDATATGRAMAAHDVTGISLVPTQLRRLLDAGWTPPDFLRFVLLGGAPAGPDLLADCAAAGVPVCPTYGTTETASQIATATPGAVEGPREAVGSPLVVADVTIVDPADGQPVPSGETGELVVDGPIVTPGYLDEEATAAVMGEFGLHTGDLATRDEAGRLTIHGRLDDAIQTGGETVHPARVTRALRALPGVADAAVVGIPDREWGERVAALVVPAAGEAVAESAIREAIRDGLADYEVPKTIRTASSLPRTDSGTIDRGAVRQRLADDAA